MEAQAPDWYLREWAERLNKRQVDFVNHTGWVKSRVSKMWNGHQPYSRDLVNTVSAWLGIEPYELLMHPIEATAIRQLRESAAVIAGSASSSQPPD